MVAKALANGMPISAILGRRDLMEAWPPAAHGSTFGGNPVSCAAALATIEVMEREGLAERAARVGAGIQERLSESVSRQPGVAEVRGLGLMLGIEFGADEGWCRRNAREAVRPPRLSAMCCSELRLRRRGDPYDPAPQHRPRRPGQGPIGIRGGGGGNRRGVGPPPNLPLGF